MQRQEALFYLQLKARDKKFASTKYVVVKNGVFNLGTWQLENFTPDIITRNKVPIAYVPNSYYEATDDTLNKIAVND